MRMIRAVGAVAAVALVACGAVGGGSHMTQPPPVATPAAAVAHWAGFPADQKPRPIVLFWELYTTGGGFKDGDSKLAAFCNKFSLATSVPKDIPATGSATWSDGTTASYGVISAAEAFAAISKPSPGANADMCAPLAPLQITSVRFATVPFSSDRGTVQMPAWIFGSPTALGELKYPALSPSAFWKAGFTALATSDSSNISPDGLTLTFGFTGAQPASTGPCGADYKAVVAESTSAVAVAVQEIARAEPGGPVACDTVGYPRLVTLTLAGPLGGRVVVDGSGNATPVCPVSRPEC